MVKQDPEYTKFAKDWASKDRPFTAQDIKFLDSLFKTNGVKSVLDVACGSGRLTFPLHELGYAIQGSDLSSQFIRLNLQKSKSLGHNLKFFNEDMRRLKSHGKFDAVICMWGSFTYLESIDDMLSALKGMNKNLKKGGILIIDVAPGWHDLVISKRYKLKMHDRPVKNGRICLTDCKLDPADQFALQHDRYIVYKDGKAIRTEDFDRKRYFFTPTMFDLLLRNSGFGAMELYADWDIRKKLPQTNLNRLIAVAKKF